MISLEVEGSLWFCIWYKYLVGRIPTCLPWKSEGRGVKVWYLQLWVWWLKWFSYFNSRNFGINWGLQTDFSFLLTSNICKKEGEARIQGAWAAAGHTGVHSNGRYVLVWNGAVEDRGFWEPPGDWESTEACPFNSVVCGLTVCSELAV